jgi:single-stranded DNA-binding protein
MAWLNTTLRLSGKPKPIQTRSGVSMTTAYGFADIGADSGWGIGVVAFGGLAVELTKYDKGSTLAITGKLQANDWVDKEGNQREGMQIVVDSLAGIKRRSPVRDEPWQSDKTSKATSKLEPLNDDIDF